MYKNRSNLKTNKRGDTMTTTDYTPMWKELGLDLAGHDALLNVLGNAYNDILKWIAPFSPPISSVWNISGKW
jgi:hypothetical protein